MRVVILRLNQLTSDARTHREAAALGAVGHDVTVLALRDTKCPDCERRPNYRVLRVADPTTASLGQIGLKIRQSRERQRVLVENALVLRPQVVHSHDTDTLQAGARIKRYTGARLVWGADELFPEMLVANRRRLAPGVLAYWRGLEWALVRHTDAVVTVGDGLARELSRRFGVTPAVVRNVPDLVPEGDRALLRARLGSKPQDVNLLYQGLINVGRGLELVIEILPRLPSVHFVLQGTGPALQDLLEIAQQSAASARIHYLGSAPIDELHDWASGADVGDVLLENASLNNYLAAPNKLYQYMMAGIPTLASDFPEMAAILGDGPAGLLADPDNQDDVVDRLRLLASDPGLRCRLGLAARRLAETRYNWDLEKEKLLEVYDRLAASRSTS